MSNDKMLYQEINNLLDKYSMADIKTAFGFVLMNREKSGIKSDAGASVIVENNIVIIHTVISGISDKTDYTVHGPDGNLLVDYKDGDLNHHFLPGKYYFKGTKIRYKKTIDGATVKDETTVL